MLISKKNRRTVYKYLFQEGVLQAEKDFNKAVHSDELDVPNLQVIKLMQSFVSLELVTERFAWRHYYWFLTDKGIEYLREYLGLPQDVVPATMKKSQRPLERVAPRAGGDRPGGARRFGGGEGGGGFGGREGYRREGGGGAGGGGFGRGGGADDKAGAPGAYVPRFGGMGRGSAPPAAPPS
eukprot:CAMPEP_0119105508 /NCGR_PEP_ID=MMETSP1180-20130426/3431_1 /TAXON_ID=3052 ORGANISM="Chlamydomonas cf sp, Strain CCMP681" /NCGR_SAMPLE_ID=MMETSP1180 /ASSEMBLY_ACC=CAM_ASM_000741 /LENGTH=180 /DNA_ID=CAMNT_0007090561 /DNA_START=119 /DNA_END=661 /DNA_ORIENTATION=-